MNDARTAVIPPSSSTVRPAPWPPAAAALNLTGFGLGYVFLRRWWIGGVYLVLTAVLVLLAFLTDAGEAPWLWRIVALVWVLAAAGHAWWLARRDAAPVRQAVAQPGPYGPYGPPPGPYGPNPYAANPYGQAAPVAAPAPTSAQRLVPLGVAVAVLAVTITGYLLYVGAGDRTYADAVTAQGRGDCATAAPAFGRVSGIFELTLSANSRDAAARGKECDELVVADEQRASGQQAAAVTSYRAFRTAYPASSLVPVVDRDLQATFAEWGTALRAKGDRTGAITVYRDGLNEPGAAAQLRPELAATYLERAADTVAAFPFNGPQLVESTRSVTDDLLTVRSEFADTPSAGMVGKGLADMVAALGPKLATIGSCNAAPVLDHLASLPPAQVTEIAAPVAQARAGALLACGLENYQANRLDQAAASLGALEASYPNAAEAAQARSARIAAEVALAKGGQAPALPPPFAGDSPGTIAVTFFNVSPTSPSQVLVSGSSTHQFDLPVCAGCAPDDPRACDSASGKPSVVVRLKAGVFDVLLRPVSGGGTTPKVNTDTFTGGGTYRYCVFTTPTR